ncbi:MAG: chemotaxis protein CheA [Sulfobacillus acidophilus]|uniref:Stage 0 sporulation protein A homolog n=1 Tax=Sulfobacillus acidophilus TaxID=53633 RepID=A0A2T2WKL2_9FIRM|nr:MAG: chemotaxis protein CheA [Sulfobacillus acidophilus]
MRFSEVQWDSEEERLLFVEEAAELLGTLEEGALKTPPPMDAMFRAAHTLKGSGGMLGLTQWVDRAHRVEDAMDRRGHPNWEWTPELQQFVLDTVDAMRAELQGQNEDPGATTVWELRWDSTCAMPGVRAYQAWTAINALIPGTVSEPPEDALAEWTGEVSRLVIPSSTVDPDVILTTLQSIDDLQAVTRVDRPLQFTPASLDAHESLDTEEVETRRMTAGERRDATIRISADSLESILEGLGELLLDHGQLEHLWQQTIDPAVRNVLDHLRRRALDLQDLTLRARMLPLDTLFRQYPRAIHDIARKLNKKIQLTTTGGETELDRVVMDRLHEPLLHLLRNACDHGIESPDQRRQLGKPEIGMIRLTAFTAQGHVHLRIEDDGAGIDWNKLRDKAVRQGWLTADEADRATEDQLGELLFRPGVSTADKITDISGRGVGLDVVRAFLDEIHGGIHIESQTGQGTTFHIELPMTMAIMTALLVEAGPWTLGFPIANVERIEDIAKSGLASLLGQQAVPDGQAPLPVYSLADVLAPEVDHHDRYIVRIKDGRTQAALTVDGVLGQQEVVIKPVIGLTGLTPWLSGVALLGDGRLALMVDARRLVPATGSEIEASQEPDPILKAGSNQMELLVFRLSDGQRYGINVYKTREVLPQATVTRVPGQHQWLDGFMHVRGQTVPVVSLHRALGLKEPFNQGFVLITEFNQTVQAFPVDQVERMVRVSWDQVKPLPAVLEAGNTLQFTGLINHEELGAIQLIDFEQLLAQVAPPEFPVASEISTEDLSHFLVWIADDSKVARQQIEKALKPLGVRFKLFSDGQELWEQVQVADPLPHLFIVDVEMPRLDGYTLAARLKNSARSRGIPVVLHTSLSGHWHADRASQLQVDAVITKFEPDVLASTVRELLSRPQLMATW